MKKIYEKPEIEIRDYVFSPEHSVITDSDPDLHDGPDYNYFG